MVCGTVNYDAFGQVVGTTGSSGSSYMYGATSGYRNDWDGGLMHVGARYYDPQVGRFVTPDSFLSENPFLYCEHDPVNYRDPSGHSIDLGTLGEVAGGIIDVIGVGFKLNPVVLAVGTAIALPGLLRDAGTLGGQIAQTIPMRKDGDVLYPPMTRDEVIEARKDLMRTYIHEKWAGGNGNVIRFSPREVPYLPPNFKPNWR